MHSQQSQRPGREALSNQLASLQAKPEERVLRCSLSLTTIQSGVRLRGRTNFFLRCLRRGYLNRSDDEGQERKRSKAASRKKKKANAPGTDRGTTEGQRAACYLAYGEAIGQNIRSITKNKTGRLLHHKPDPKPTRQPHLKRHRIAQEPRK